MWYAITQADVCDNLRSLMWGIAYKVYPKRWWLPVLNRFYTQHCVDRLRDIMALPILLAWAKEGKKRAEELNEEWAPSGLDDASSVCGHALCVGS